MKKLFYFVSLLFLLCSPVLSYGEHLKGRVVLIDKHDKTSPVEGVDVTLKETGDTVRTKAQGLFRIFIQDSFKAGETVTFLVAKDGYCIQYPLEGEHPIPADLGKNVVEIRLLPVGSKKLWSEDRIESFIKTLAEKSKEQIRPGESPQDIDFSEAIKEWAVKYGFSAEQAKAKIDKWVAETKSKENDFHKLGLAAFAEKQFGKAESLFKESADGNIKELAALKTQAQQLTDDIISDLRLAGDAAYNDYKFQKAIENYKNALSFVAKDKQPRLWGAIQLEIGNANEQQGLRTEAQKMHDHLKQAIICYRNALQVYTRDQLPQQWATTQNNLGTALSDQGIRTGGEQGQALLAEAVKAYRNALEIRTYETLPPQWAQTKYNLTEAYCLLEEWQKAADCYTDCLNVYPNSRGIIYNVSAIYHERLFDFDKAYEMDTFLIENLGLKDLSTLINYVEKKFTTGRFKEMEKYISKMHLKINKGDEHYTALVVFDIACCLVRNNNALISKKLDELILYIEHQPEEFNLGWTFDGTKHFINTSQKIQDTDRQWLISFFSALEGKNRDAILEKLRQLK